jgi:hypothetical protein
MAHNSLTPSEWITQTIVVILQSLEKADDVFFGLKMSEIYRQLQTRGLSEQIIGDSDDWRWVREVADKEKDYVKDHILRMVRDGELETRSDPRRRGQVYHLPGHGTFQAVFDFQYTRADIERELREDSELWAEDEAELEQSSTSVLQDIAAGHAREVALAQAIREVAVELAGENPVDLILEMAGWVVDDINHLAKEISRVAESQPEKKRRLVREIGFRRNKAIRFFQRLFRLDAPTDGDIGFLNIPEIRDMMDNKSPIQAHLNSTRAREQLEKRIVGDHVIEILALPENTHKAAVGSDASVGDVRVRHERGSFIPPTPAVLFVASGTMHVHDKDGMLPYWDYDIDPRKLSEYDDLEAAELGYLISPRLRREAISDFRHLRSAAMELRQYAQELRIIRREAKWYPVGNVPELGRPPALTLLIRDGRLFPLVHRLDDYDGASAPDDVLYGQIVQREINAFQEMFHNTAGKGRLAPIYSGTVKSPVFSWFSMLTFWYLQVKENYEDLQDGFYRPLLNDQAVTHLLFWGLAESNHKASFANHRNMMVTFQTIRRFSDIAFPSHPQVIEEANGNVDRIVDEDDEDDWIDYIEQHIEEANLRYNRHRRGVPALSTPEEYSPFLNLCRRAGVAMFYAAPVRMYQAVIDSQAHFLLPRWELAIDVTQKYHAVIKDRLPRLLEWLVDEGGLVRDEAHAVGGFEEVTEGLPLFIPDVVKRAHETVVYTRDRHVPEIEEKLRELVSDIREGRIILVTQ